MVPNRNVTFEPLSGVASQSLCRIVLIINDSMAELNEEFSVELTSSDPDVNLLNVSSLITILDDDGKGTYNYIYTTQALYNIPLTMYYPIHTVALLALDHIN